MNFDFLSPILGTLSQVHIRWLTLMTGAKIVGTDEFGNRYFTHTTPGRPPRRWVMYKGYVDASEIPPEWHAWMHHQTDVLPNSTEAAAYRRRWIKPYVPNMTGTSAAYHPPGSQLAAAHRAKATGDYQAWRPAG